MKGGLVGQLRWAAMTNLAAINIMATRARENYNNEELAGIRREFEQLREENRGLRRELEQLRKAPQVCGPTTNLPPEVSLREQHGGEEK